MKYVLICVTLTHQRIMHRSTSYETQHPINVSTKVIKEYLYMTMYSLIFKLPEI